ncbi:hypothetical protein [Hasllibacter sp. MH4015]|uniref:hypothetical protein n=1 Tax=Hasllibacter sp. MH4015 TaxID=2854029 RepID=UPI001CD44AD7|nr:hypothetical protein [Hasllibacter sp. MH4015]
MALGAGAIPAFAVAQDAPLPATEIQSSRFTESFPETGAGLAIFGVGPDFRAEMRARDRAGVIDHSGQPAGLEQTDILVVLAESWEEASAAFASSILEPVNAAIQDAEPDVFVVIEPVALGHGFDMLTFTFIDRVDGEAQDPRCMARAVIDYVYRGGDGTGFDSPACSRALN